MADFAAADAVVAAWEGGHEADPADPGGDTWYGIARRYHPDEPWPPTPERAQAIRRSDYWNAVHGDELADEGVALMLYDAAINQGVDTAVRMLQQALGVSADGIFGPQTHSAVLEAAARAPGRLVDELLARRAIHYVSAPNFLAWAHNWFSRLAVVHRAAVQAG